MEEMLLEKQGANFYGFERIDSQGKRHWELSVIRGNGDLRLTEGGLYFSRWVPPMEVFVPVAKIKKVEIGNSHNGRWTPLSKILKVFYEEGAETRILGASVGRKKETVLEWKKRIEGLLT